ncbi:MAG: hydroxyacylglutathione hydrolase C-terminal domain-containing protein, partial [Rhodoblastus sp.]
AALPEETRVYCGHEYTLGNAKFAVTVDPGNVELARRATEISAMRAAGQYTLPTTLGLELATTPFLRADDPGVQAAVGMAGKPAAEVFTELRERKNRG